MSSILLTGPALEPLTLAEAKAFLRVEHDADDDLMASLIVGARIHVESETRRALITQSWRIVRDTWPPDGRITVTPAPLRSVAAARVYDCDGNTHTIDTQAFVVDKATAMLAFAPWSLAQPGCTIAGIEIDISVGYGAAASDVPQPLRHAIRLLVAHWYENRAVTAVGHDVAVLPATVPALLAPYRMLAL